ISGVAVLLALPDNDDKAIDRTVAAARELVATIDAGDCGRIVLAGSATNSVTLGEAIRADLQSLVVLSYLAIALTLLLLLRSLSATLLIMFVISLSVAATMGVFGWLGFVLSPTAGFVPSVVLTIAVADCVHVVSNYLIELGRGRTRDAAIAESLRINLGPVTITSLTTAIGMLSLNLSDSPPYRDLGNMVAVGVGVAFILSLTLLPAVLRLLPPLRPPAYTLQLPIDAFADWLIRRQKALLYGGGALVLILASFLFRNELTEHWHDYFTEHFEIRSAIEVIDRNLGGIHRLYYDLESGVADGVTEPAYLQQLQEFSQWFESQPGVGFTSGLHDTLRSLNRAFNDDDPAFFVLPDSRAASAQFMLLYELSLPVGESLDNIVDQDRSASRLTVSLHKTDSESLLELDRRARQWLTQNAPAVAPRPGTGLDLVFANITHRNIRGLLTGTAVALVAISLLLTLALRSIRLGLVSLLPNLAPAAVAYGLWGIFGGYIDLALSVVVCMSLGIVVDDTVHFMSKYMRARRELGLDAADGIRHAFHTVGLALVITSIVLVTGFAVLAFSYFNPTRETGSLLALTIALALVIDFLVLPPLLLATARHE
ncbi:MAG: MMPL family transporter, partial [Gammaproteobacteria bacterium]|nr:MMPL family transporter [Gammaproteobacteria bacterium]